MESTIPVSVADSVLHERFSDGELLARLRDTEDGFVERKTRGDRKDWLPAAVAFANSAPIGYPAILFIGVKDNGDLEGGDGCNFESLQKTFNKEVAKAYPPIFCWPRALRVGNAECLAVIIPGSESRPHFAGQAWVRKGSQRDIASEEQFGQLIAQRNSRAYEILKWKGKAVMFEHRGMTALVSEAGGTIVDCNQFYVTYETAGARASVPLSRIEISFDHLRNVLKLEIRPM